MSENTPITIQALIDKLQAIDDKSLELFMPDNTYDPTGVFPVSNITELLDGFNKIIGYVII